MKQTTVFKVVYSEKGKLYSGFTGYFSRSQIRSKENLPDHVLEYEIGEKTSPKFGKLFAFGSLRDAQDYCRGMMLDIYEAVAHGKVVKSKSKTVVFADSCSRDMKMVWAKKGLRKFYCRTQQVARGTVLCESLTLVKKID